MKKATTSLLSLLILFLAGSSSAAARTATSTSFIQTKCRSTTYPTLCVKSLSGYANSIQKSPRKMAEVALAVSLTRARHAKVRVGKMCKSTSLKPREVGALKDCEEEMADTVDRLEKSLHELQRAGQAGRREEFAWRISNVETWVSAGLTDDSTCVDGFSGRALNGKVKDSIRAQMVEVVHYTSNALALVTQYANERY